MSKLIVAGIMTGTSCDGADFAALEFSAGKNKTQEKLVFTASRKFPNALRSRLREAQAGKIGLRDYGALNRDYSEWLALFAKDCLKKLKKNSSHCALSVHGQTLWHEPPKTKDKRGFTLQMIDPAMISSITGCTTVSFFRQPDMALHGHGAPLVPYYHWLKARESGLKKDIPFAIHNVGGIANLTCVTDKSQNIIAFDTGPGNALIDLAVERMTSGRLKYDKNGSIALSALEKINWPKIEILATHSYFKAKPPKSTGRELFNLDFLKIFKTTGSTLVAEATAFTAHSMALAYRDHVLRKIPNLRQIYLAGGGAKNPILEQLFDLELQSLTGKEIAVDILPPQYANSQFLEAMAFARLGLNGLCGLPVSLSHVTGARENARGAGIFPGKNHSSLMKIV